MRRFLITIMTLCALGGAAAAQEIEQRHVTVTGEGTASAVPDIALITLGVQIRADAPDAAMESASEAAGRILARMSEMGLADSDVQTTNLSLEPVYDRNGEPGASPEPRGFEARNMLTVRVRDLERLGDVLAAALDDGATSLGGLQFDLSEPKPLLDAARRAAVSDARAKAELLAETAGTALGEVLQIEETGGGNQPMPMAEMRASSVPVAAGESTVSTRVRIVYALGD
ncbi:26 kDa periplasmic immunogenic protein precursor [Roseivivax jejudonensis]|uniref:26 kDa periplasmic immunogenic protein n=1 Tax=Roseivivax jejudonensis TaxID=1529041 RepID=A0A1X6ZAY3_9RHOB|nr:SIMPL domain-containing protein [Roseivivax jejudonensis]SLN44085.1 26 kDa periplasmic immunogenic protein precursor [Roseivivax jejudonensis]